MMRMLLVPWVVMALVVPACGGDDGDGEGEAEAEAEAEGEGITLSGQLLDVTPSGANGKRRNGPSGSPLVGYQLYCVTFSEPPVAASDTSDKNGAVVVSFDASGIAFGCFILDSGGNGVATVIFTSGANRGQTIRLSGDTVVGDIRVDVASGTAEAMLGSDGEIVVTPSDAPCPLGTWVIVTMDSFGCSEGDAEIILWVTRTPEDTYRASFTAGPFSADCYYYSESNLLATYSTGVLAFSFGIGDASCPAKGQDIRLTPTEDCMSAEVEHDISGCISCDSQNHCVDGCGGATCSRTWSAMHL